MSKNTLWFRLSSGKFDMITTDKRENTILTDSALLNQGVSYFPTA